jgi:IclR family acetate operon transcriptional repressor
MSSPRQPRHPITSVDNALKLLLMFREQRRIRVSEASAALGVVPSTAHRLMAMLEYHGLVEQDPESKAYRSGPMLTEIALKVLGQMDLRALVRPYLERLSAEANETVHFVVLDHTDALFVDGVECSRPVRTALRVGDRRPAHCTSSGKVLLAELSADEVRARYADSLLTACTPQSIREIAALLRELETVSGQGYGLSIGESESEIAAVAAAVPGPHGRALGAFSISMPMTRYDERALIRLGDAARAMAQDASGRLAQALDPATPPR